jgi:hypothetical protein
MRVDMQLNCIPRLGWRRPATTEYTAPFKRQTNGLAAMARFVALGMSATGCVSPVGIPDGAKMPISAAEGRTSCPFERNQPLEAVQRFYSLTDEPKPLEQPSDSGSVSYYNLQQFGVWLFFSADRKLRRLRFEAPFDGKIGGVAIGDLAEDVLRRRGEPSGIVPGMIEGWAPPGTPGTPGAPGGPSIVPTSPRQPDGLLKTQWPAQQPAKPAPGQPVPQQQWLPIFMRGLVYGSEAVGAVRYDIAMRDRRVRVIFATDCKIR